MKEWIEECLNCTTCEGGATSINSNNCWKSRSRKGEEKLGIDILTEIFNGSWITEGGFGKEKKVGFGSTLRPGGCGNDRKGGYYSPSSKKEEFVEDFWKIVLNKLTRIASNCNVLPVGDGSTKADRGLGFTQGQHSRSSKIRKIRNAAALGPRPSLSAQTVKQCSSVRPSFDRALPRVRPGPDLGVEDDDLGVVVVGLRVGRAPTVVVIIAKASLWTLHPWFPE
ncbi:hypothetical protein JAAARDRAFT_80701 [Jaapia argillacea MUCL 33604]|uniref:Uncharacterized protein n=1 Tax=Jaapia argillacea MUCL 33604 TaxID=933084 RepID=A0A067PTG3_9AGAM|nr:hypothetical protein JAAARDRAFT_80701 [Jaapia argillacea MUCL 33604]